MGRTKQVDIKIWEDINCHITIGTGGPEMRTFTLKGRKIFTYMLNVLSPQTC